MHAYLVAFVWVDSQRFKDADCVSVGCSDLKIKKKKCSSSHYSPPLVLLHTSTLKREGSGDGEMWAVQGKSQRFRTSR